MTCRNCLMYKYWFSLPRVDPNYDLQQSSESQGRVLLQHTCQLSNLRIKYADAEADKKRENQANIIECFKRSSLLEGTRSTTALHWWQQCAVPCVLARSKIFKTTFSLVDSEIIFNIYISISWVW